VHPQHGINVKAGPDKAPDRGVPFWRRCIMPVESIIRAPYP
jgi:hypothetical protein